VATFPFVGGSTHVVITPLWMPGGRLLLADASAAMVPNATTAPATSFHVAVGNFAMLDLPPYWALWSASLPLP
jgi:hypothetical protein